MKTIVLPAEGSGGPAAGDGAWGDGAPGGGASAGNAPGCPASIPGPQAVTGLILAGGRSRRMGEPKALLPLGGETVLAALVEQLRRRCARVFVVSSRAGREAYGKYPVIVDEADDQGPLMGLCSGLAASPTEINLVAACDIPRLPSPLLDALLGCMSEHDIAFVSLPWRGGDQPLLGAYRRAVLPAVRKLLERGERRIVELFPLARTVRVLVEDDRWYANLNTPGDYREFLTRREQPAAAGCGTPGRSAESTASEDAAEAEMREEAGKAEGAEAPTPARQPPGPGEEEDLAPFVAFEVVRVRSGGAWRAEQPVASEVPCTIVANGVELATLACTPSLLRELAAGFLLSSGFVAGAGEILEIAVDSTSWTVSCSIHRTPDARQLERRVHAPGCGRGIVYASASEALGRRPLVSAVRLTIDRVAALAGWLQRSSELYRQTGGVHTAAIAPRGEPPPRGIDDVARHCAVDKAIGGHLLAGGAFEEAVLACSGRVSADIAAKARRAGIPIIVARGGPTHQAVLRARAWGVTLIGFARGGDFTVYAHPERVEGTG